MEKKATDRLHLVMDESDAPYEKDEYEPDESDDLLSVELAIQYGLEFLPGTTLAKLAEKVKASDPDGP